MPPTRRKRYGLGWPRTGAFTSTSRQPQAVHLEGNSCRHSRQSGAGESRHAEPVGRLSYPGFPPIHRLAESLACPGTETKARILSPGPSRPMGGRPATCLHVEGRLPIGREARRASARAASRAWAGWVGALPREARSASSAPLLPLRIYFFSRGYRTQELGPAQDVKRKSSSGSTRFR